MNRTAANADRFTRAQLRYDFAAAPVGAAECPECNGKGDLPDPDGSTFRMVCWFCEGARFTNDAGDPVFVE